jgi:Na+-transporting methylmalonyl-CoA/oxaloacetate decarboxylase gamma subunit
MIDFSAMDQDIEPIRHTLSARLGYLKIYREDVDQLLAMFQQSCEKVTISDSKHRYKTLDAMKANLPNPLKEFNIQGENPGVSFVFNQMELVRGASTPATSIFNELRTDETTDAADALFYKTKDFLLTHQQASYRKEFLLIAIIPLLGLIWVISHNTTVNKDGDRVFTGFGIVFLFVCVLALVLSIVGGGVVKNFLSLETKKNSAPFFVKNWEEFAKQSVTATISAVIGGIVGWFVGHYFK